MSFTTNEIWFIVPTQYPLTIEGYSYLVTNSCSIYVEYVCKYIYIYIYTYTWTKWQVTTNTSLSCQARQRGCHLWRLCYYSNTKILWTFFDENFICYDFDENFFGCVSEHSERKGKKKRQHFFSEFFSFYSVPEIIIHQNRIKKNIYRQKISNLYIFWVNCP